MPRDYDGVAVLWHSSIDHDIRPVDDGGERIQCVEVTVSGNDKLLVVSVYFPTKGGTDSVMDFQDCLDQLYEIFQKYQTTHHIITGGDLNEDLSSAGKRNKRLDYLINFISELNFNYTCSVKTFMNSTGVDCTETDYFLVKCPASFKVQKNEILHLSSNTSGHYPIRIQISLSAKINRKVL